LFGFLFLGKEGEADFLGRNSWEGYTSRKDVHVSLSMDHVFSMTLILETPLFQIFGWEPKFYNDTKNLPSGMPADLQEHIRQEELANRLDTVWVSCAGENPADVENMGAIQYIPRRGFPGYYFPFKNTPGYLSPLVAVFFEKPKCTYGPPLEGGSIHSKSVLFSF